MSVEKETSEGLKDRVISISRVAKVVKGGRRFSFSALVVVGDARGQVGFGVGKANEVPDAIKKGSEHAKKNLMDVVQVDGTLPFEVNGTFRSSRVIMYPAKSGKGVIAGGAARQVLELAGLKDVVCKIHGSKNPHNVVRATVDGLKQLVELKEYAASRGVEAVNLLQKKRKSKGENVAKPTEPAVEASS